MQYRSGNVCSPQLTDQLHFMAVAGELSLCHEIHVVFYPGPECFAFLPS
jgi:hypothetical protein